MSVSLPDDAPKPRLCHVRKWDDFNGYGFNLHAEKGKAGQYIGKVDPDSPADFAGLKEGDRIVEVNGTNISNENHQQVVQRVKAISNETKLLVLDSEAEEYYKAQKIVVRGDMPNVRAFETPERNPKSIAQNAVENNVSDSGSEKGEDRRSSRSSSVSREAVEAVAAATVVADDPPTVHPYKVRLCHLKIWSNFAGYGFNLHAEKNKTGQYIGKVDPGSPAEAAGLQEHDRIIEVNGQNVTGESHQHVVTIIKSVPNETKLLVLSPQADDYFKERGVTVSGTVDFVDRIVCPDTKPVTESPVNLDAPTDSTYKARLIQLRTWPNYSGYGFNMHSIKGKEGEYIGKIEPGSPAFIAGLREGDRVIEVGKVNTEKDSHGDVVEKIKAASGKAVLLVVDAEADAYFRDKQIRVTSTMSAVTVLNCPETKPEANGTSEAIISQARADTSSANTRDEVSLEADKIADSIMASVLEAEKSLDANEAHAAPTVTPTPAPAPAPVKKEAVVMGGIEFAGSVEEARKRMSGKKREVRSSSAMSAKEKYELFQKL